MAEQPRCGDCPAFVASAPGSLEGTCGSPSDECWADCAVCRHYPAYRLLALLKAEHEALKARYAAPYDDAYPAARELADAYTAVEAAMGEEKE